MWLIPSNLFHIKMHFRKKSYIYYLLIISLLPFTFKLYGQESNYWYSNYGAGSFLMGGIEVGGVSNNSAVYYNPGALCFIEGEYFEAQADVISADVFKIENGVGEGLPVTFLQMEASPSLFSYTKHGKTIIDYTYAISVLTKNNSNINFNADYEAEGNYMLPNEQIDVFHGSYYYANRVRENWLSGALSFKISEHIGVGISGNLVVRAQDFTRSYSAEVFAKNDTVNVPGEFSKAALVNYSQLFTLRSIGLIFKPAIRVNFDQLKLGLALTTPNISLGLLKNKAQRKEKAILPDINDNILYEANTHNDYSGVYRTPFIIDFGVAYKFSKTEIAGALALFLPVDKYNMIRHNENSRDYINQITPNTEFAYPKMAHKTVLNFGLAVIHQFRDNIYYIGSLRTDFNFFDSDKLDRLADFVPNMAYWDMYHLTSGIVIEGPRTSLAFGLNYGLGLSWNDLQLVNMTTASQDNFLIGDRNSNTSTQFHNFGFIFGLNYTINKMEGLKY